ncbi:outer membrane protein transport protein [Vibrio sp. ZSDE26]|uniref:Outer membrane protein transport protein n=1 Tax=Vibrio amylolyticus TaxID=2847292 RepID=A0A9X2BHL1_9VIBR|nr:outer membrane protein transport protein [Vibrio amylolyticus]MCK6264096.1 outer membrane protein transport protein [Vibrio amylolyticus]
MSRTLHTKHRRTTPVFALSLLGAAIFSATAANASGLFMQEAIIANAGTTGAGDGVYTQSAAAMWANPATMSHMGESMTTINTMLLDLEMKYTDANDSTGNAKADTVMPSIGIFHTRQLNDDVHLGLALGTVGGSSVSYGNEWAGNMMMTDTTLTAVQFNPSLSFRVTDQVSWGIGAQFNWASLEMGMGAGNVQLEKSSDWAYGFNAGVMYKQSDKLDLGFSFRSKVEHDFSTDISANAGSLGVSSEISVPAIVDMSASYAATNQLNILASVQLHRWSEWDETVFDFGQLDRNPIGLNTIDRDWDDVWKFAIGADYQLNADWRLKAGFSYETSPQDDPSKQWVDLPVGEQYRYSVGATTSWDNYTFDVFYEFADLGSVDIAERNIGPASVGINGTFDGRIHFVGMSVTF